MGLTFSAPTSIGVVVANILLLITGLKNSRPQVKFLKVLASPLGLITCTSRTFAVAIFTDRFTLLTFPLN